MMKKCFTLLAVIALLTGCGKTNRPELHVYNWDDYIDESVLKDFEKEFDCRIIYDTYASNEDLLAKFQAGAKGYDIIFPSDYLVAIMAEEGMLYPIDHDKIPNLKYLDEQFTNPPFDPGLKYSVPYTYGFSGIGYDTDEIDGEVNSWDLFWDPRYAGRVLLLDDMREVFGIAFKKLGYSINDTVPAHLEEALIILKDQKKYLKKYESSMSKNLLLSGEVVAIHHWGGDVYQAIEEDSSIAFTIPDEGSILFTDCMAIPASAPNIPLAESFINYILRPEISGRIVNMIWYPMPNIAANAFVDEEILNDPSIYVAQSAIRKSEFLKDLGEYTKVMERAWSELKIE